MVNLRDLVLKPPQEMPKEELMKQLAELKKLRTLHVPTQKTSSGAKRSKKGTKTKTIVDELTALSAEHGLDPEKLKKIAEDMGIA